MNIPRIGTFSYSPQSMGSQVVNKTLDSLNNTSGASSLVNKDKQVFGAAVVSKTLDYMNAASPTDSTSATYDFSNKVLGQQYNGAGRLMDLNVYASRKGSLIDFNV